MPTTQRKPKRRSPISRAVGEKRLIEATIDLVREQPFSEVGVRDIARRADINHGFVHVWFGSKHLLFTAARNHLLNNLIDKYSGTLGQPQLPALNDPDTRLLVRLSIWLEIEGADGIEMPITTPLAEAVARGIAKEYDMSPEVAAMAGRLAVGLAVGNLALERTFNWGQSGAGMRQQWNEVLKLLAAAHPA